MDQTSALDLGVPPQRKPDRDSFDLRPKAVDAWLKNLPIANLGETSRALYETLKQVNQLRIKPAQRLDFLERLLPQVIYVIDGLRKHYPPKEFPLPPRSRKVAELSMALLREMATGYNAIIQPVLTGEGRVPKQRLTRAIQRSIRLHGRVLVANYSLYEPVIGGLWRTLNGLYKTAEQRKLHKLAVDDPTLASGTQSSIDDTYKQALLLAAAGPYRMRHNESAEIYAVLERWAPHSRLATSADDAMFMLDLDSDRGPGLVQPSGKARDPRLLLTHGVLQLLNKQLQPRRSSWWRFWSKPEPVQDQELLQRLMVALGVLPKRQFSRQPIASRAQVMVGLSHISRVLAHQHGLADAQPQEVTSQFTSKEIQAAGEPEPDIWELVFTGGDGTGAPAPRPTRPAGTTTVTSQPDTQNWRLLNISAGGYCLLSDPTQSARAQVGELIALREYGDNAAGAWQTGVIRWMKHVPAEGLQLGVQVLAPNPLPVLVQPELDDGGFGATGRGLLLPEIIATDQPVTLLTPSLHFCARRRVKLKSAGNASEVLLTREIESTGAFSQYEFRAAGSDEDAAEGFESVFSSI